MKPKMARSLYAHSLQVTPMAENHAPQTPASSPRPVPPVSSANNSPERETPPLSPGIHDFEIEAYNTLKMHTTGPLTNGHVARGTRNGWQFARIEDMEFAHSEGMEIEISAYPTAKMQAVKPADPKIAGNKQ